MERLCINCKHYDPPQYYDDKPGQCHALRGKQHPVVGCSMTCIEAGLMRLTLCGWNDPKFFEPAPKGKEEDRP